MESTTLDVKRAQIIGPTTVNVTVNFNPKVMTEELKLLEISGNLVKLPKAKLHHYPKIRAALLKAGGTYKRNTFIFPQDPTPIIDSLISGQTVNFAKENQFFETPPKVATKMLKNLIPEPGMSILEPSAGRGAILLQLPVPEQYDIYVCEDNHINRGYLIKSCPWVTTVACDFFNVPTSHKYWRIVANPPFTNGQYIDHIRKMYDHLYPGGRMVSLAMPNYQWRNESKYQEFKMWLEALCAHEEKVPANSFATTSIETIIITIDK